METVLENVLENDESGVAPVSASNLVVAPMMGRTDAAGCAYLRAVLPQALLFTEMIAAGALAYGGERATTRLLPSRADTRLLPSRADTRLLPSRATTRLLPSRADTRLLPSRATTRLLPSRATTRLLPSRADTRLLPSRADTRLLPSRATTRLLPSRATTRLGEYFDLLALTKSGASNASNSRLGLQLGGCEAAMLSRAIEIARDYPFCEFNLNLGCPSARVGSGGFGAFLMKDAARAASCVAAMVRASRGIRVSVKTRIGVDELDSYEHFRSFIERLHGAGCEIFYIHARKAWLHGISPRANRNLPPLRADFVERLQAEMPRLRIFYNGGIADREAASAAISRFGGVMVGRALWRAPYGFRSINNSPQDCLAQSSATKVSATQVSQASRREIAILLFAMARRNLQSTMQTSSPSRTLGNSLRLLQRAMSLYHSQPCASEWRRLLQTQVFCLQEKLRENMLRSEASESLSERLSASLGESLSARLSDNFC